MFLNLCDILVFFNQLKCAGFFRFAGRRFAGSPVRRFADSPVTSHDALLWVSAAYIAIGRTSSAFWLQAKTGDFFTIKGCSFLVATHSFGNCSDWLFDERVELEAGTVYPGCYRCSVELKDGRQQCLEDGTMRVELFRRRQRWKLIHRYTESPLPSVVLNVGSLYAGTTICRCAPIRRYANLLCLYAGSPVRSLPIRSVERWNLIRRLAGRRSPVPRFAGDKRWNLIRRLMVIDSVVSNVWIRYANLMVIDSPV